MQKTITVTLGTTTSQLTFFIDGNPNSPTANHTMCSIAIPTTGDPGTQNYNYLYDCTANFTTQMMNNWIAIGTAVYTAAAAAGGFT